MNPPRAYAEIDLGGQNLNCKFKTFKATHAVQLPYKYYTLSDISPSNKTSRNLEWHYKTKE